MIKKYYFIILIALPFVLQAAWEDSPYFNTSLLSDYPAVQKSLLASEGFTKVSFTTEDDIQLVGLYKEVANAKGNIILPGGFYPGQKEGMASYYPYIAQDYNILFYDARGHGESSGQFLSALEEYGKYDYLDVIAAMDFVKERNSKQTLILSICIGSYHTVRALAYLEDENLLFDYKIVGLVIDSGIISLRKAMKIPTMHLREKVLPGMLANQLYGKATKRTKENAKVSLPFWLAENIALPLIDSWIKVCDWRSTDRETYEDIFQQIKKITCPVFYTHGCNDEYSDIEDIKKIAQSTKKVTCWFIEGRSSHTNNQLIHKHEYKKRFDAFLDKCFKQN